MVRAQPLPTVKDGSSRGRVVHRAAPHAETLPALYTAVLTKIVPSGAAAMRLTWLSALS